MFAEYPIRRASRRERLRLEAAEGAVFPKKKTRDFT
jgi:hypothetical protein